MPKFTYRKHELQPDAIYGDLLVAKFINHVMKEGKKSLARRIVYKALAYIKTQTKKDPLEVFRTALENAAPVMEVRSKRVGGATYQVPVEVRGDRRMGLAMRWIRASAVSKKKKPLEEKLAEELLAAYKNEGPAVKKKEDMHRMAEANKAFAHFAW